MDQAEQFWISTAPCRLASVVAMFTIHLSQIFVLDQDKALDFYVGVLGLEVKVDQDLGFMRWLTVFSQATPTARFSSRFRVRQPWTTRRPSRCASRVSKGATGGWIGFVTDDCQKTYDDLAAKGVEFTDGPTERPYGKDFGLRDPFGNAIRVLQPAA